MPHYCLFKLSNGRGSCHMKVKKAGMRCYLHKNKSKIGPKKKKVKTKKKYYKKHHKKGATCSTYHISDANEMSSQTQELDYEYNDSYDPSLANQSQIVYAEPGYYHPHYHRPLVGGNVLGFGANVYI